MWKLLPIAIVVVVMIGVVVYLRVVMSSAKPQSSDNQLLQDVSSGQALQSSAPIEDRVAKIELVIVGLAKQIQDLKNQIATIQSGQTSLPTNLDGRLQTLETSVGDLKAQVAILKGTPAPLSGGSSVTSSQPPVFVPLWGSGEVTSGDWSTSYNSYDITIDPADYQGYKNVQLQVELEAFQGSGTSYAELENTGNGTAVLSSLVSTNSYYYTLVTSPTFTLSKGTYRLSLKNSTGYQTLFRNARLKINF